MKIRATDVVDEERKTLKSAVANLVIDNELPRERIRHWKTGDVVEITEKLGGAILWCLGYGLPDSRPRCANGCAANQCPSATFSTLAGASAAPFLLAKAQKPEQSYSSNSKTSPFFCTTTWLSSTAHLPGSRSLSWRPGSESKHARSDCEDLPWSLAELHHGRGCSASAGDHDGPVPVTGGPADGG